MPAIDRYVRRLEAQLASGGYASRLFLMQSNGGVMPAQSACEASSKKVFSDAAAPVDTSEGLTLQLNVMQLTTFPAMLSVMGRYCGGTPAVCSDVQVALNVESYTQGQGAKGSRRLPRRRSRMC